MRYLLFLIAALLPLPLQQTETPTDTGGQIIVFVRDTGSAVAKAFQKDILPQVKSLAEEGGMAFRLEDVSAGAPADITRTPAIVYRDAAGHSLFSGRWNQISKIRNFIRAAKVMHQEPLPLPKQDELVWRQGRLNILAPLKITPLKTEGGTSPNNEVFQALALRAVEDGTARFHRVGAVDGGLTSRGFYMAMYPFRDKRGKYHITGEIYSQYNCVDPIYTHFDIPVSHRDPAKAFQGMAAILEQRIVSEIQNPDRGDGFDPLPADTPEVAWDNYGGFDETGDGESITDAAVFQYKKEWKVAGAFADDIPMLLFRFAPPLDSYTGEAGRLSGRLTLEEGQQLGGSSGEFRIPIKAITMGDPALDKAIHKSIIKGEKHPEAVFNFSVLEAETEGMPLEGNKVWTRGKMELNGGVGHISLAGNIRPLVRNGKSYLHAKVAFSLDKTGWSVDKGPDGPEDIRDKMDFFMNFLLE